MSFSILRTPLYFTKENLYVKKFKTVAKHLSGKKYKYASTEIAEKFTRRYRINFS